MLTRNAFRGKCADGQPYEGVLVVSPVRLDDADMTLSPGPELAGNVPMNCVKTWS